MNARTTFLHAGSLALFSMAVAGVLPSRQTDQPAEKVYKNIQIFKGQPAKDVRPAMSAISAALGVQCSFCHVSDAKGNFTWESDDKDEKKTARSMYLMMKKINEDNFNGQMTVTCATCHQGHPSPNRFAPIGAPVVREEGRGAPPPNTAAPTADSLIDKYEAAIGPAGKLQSLHLKGDAQFGPEAAKVDIVSKSPNKVVSTLSFAQGVFTEGFDGTTGWSKFATQPVQPADAAEAALNSPMVFLDPKGFYKGFRGVRKDTLDGKDVYVVNAQTPFDNVRVRLYFDPVTGMLLRSWQAKSTLVGYVTSTEDYSDFRDVNGVKIPFKLTDMDSDGPRTYVFSSVTANEDVPDSTFSAPK